MKTIITSILPFIFLASVAQPCGLGGSSSNYPKEYIWAIVPDTVCPGDTVKVFFKWEYPGIATNTLTQFQWGWNLSNAWQGNYNTFYSLPCEKCFVCMPQDSMQTMKMKVPNSAPLYTQKIYAGGGSNLSFFVKNCTITGIQEHYSSSNEKPMYFDLWGNPTEKKSGVLLIEQTGLSRNKVYFD